MGSRIGELLIRSSIIDEKQLAEALDLQKHQNKKLGEILIELGYISSRDLVWMLSEQVSIPFVEVQPEILDHRLIKSFPEKMLYKHCMLPLYTIDDKIYIVLGDPTNYAAVKEMTDFIKKDIVVSAADPEIILGLLDKFFLVLQTDPILNHEQCNRQIMISMPDNTAEVRLIDANGRTAIKNASAEIIIKIGKLRSSDKE
jgi:type IV pilus assembly protein PilB